MANTAAKGNENRHPDADDADEYSGLRAKAVDVTDLVYPRDDAIQEPEGDNVLGTWECGHC